MIDDVIEATAQTDTYVVNPALRVIRSSGDEIIVRHGSRGRSTQRFSDPEAGGVLSDLVARFSEPTALSTIESERDQELLRELVESGVLIPHSQTSYSRLVAGLGRPTQPVTADVALVGEGVIAQELARCLADALPDAGITTVGAVSDLEADPDVLIAASDTPDIGFFFDVNEYALTTAVRWHAAYVDGPECVVGPLYRPGYTGCFHDFDVMDESGRSLRVDHVYAKMQKAQPHSAPVPLFMAQLVSGYLTMSVLQDLCGEGSFLEGSFLRIDADRLEVIKQQLTRLARCPACMENRPDLRHPFV
ncbi:TOMM precursor leader peptide-binding protein [Yimella sp. cx-573]|nr:TOMM precursor leader peptide-binding protein [Yimella sp. cx-573]